MISGSLCTAGTRWLICRSSCMQSIARGGCSCASLRCTIVPDGRHLRVSSALTNRGARAMPRPHIPLMQHQDQPFHYGPMGGGGPETTVGMKLLSHDPESRASSAVVEIPAGWRLPGITHIAVDEEMYVLS